MKHRHPGRVAEVYRRNPDWPQPGKGPAYLWVGFAADPPANVAWSEEMQAWILRDQEKATS
jgi:hypothetical protein